MVDSFESGGGAAGGRGLSSSPISLDSQAEQPPLSWYSLQCALPTKRTETLRSTAPLFTVFSFLGVNIPGLVAAVKMPLSALLLPSPFPMAPFSPPPPTKMTVVLSHGFLLRSKCFDASLARSLVHSLMVTAIRYRRSGAARVARSFGGRSQVQSHPSIPRSKNVGSAVRTITYVPSQLSRF